MAKNTKNKSKKDHWALAKKKYRLNASQIAMAKEIGLNPKKFGGMAPNKSERIVANIVEGTIGGIYRRLLLQKIQEKRAI